MFYVQAHNPQAEGLCIKPAGTGTLGRVCGDLGFGDARGGTWGHQVWDARTCGTGTSNIGTQEVKSEVNAISLSS